MKSANCNVCRDRRCEQSQYIHRLAETGWSHLEEVQNANIGHGSAQEALGRAVHAGADEEAWREDMSMVKGYWGGR